MSATPDPVREHLDKAENWLALAEGNRGELASLHEGTRTYTEAEDAQRWYFATMLESAKDLAELHRAMAQTINDLTPQRFATSSEVWARVRAQVEADNADDVKTMGEALAEKIRSDAAEFDAQTLRPGADPEPEAEGELWTTRDGWFYYAVDRIPPMLPGMVEKPRWLLARHYAQVLRWSSEQGAKPMPLTWSELGPMALTDKEVGTLRRPTAEERAAFYGPEPDPTPEEVREVIGNIDGPPPEGPVRFDATVQAFSDEALAVMRDAVKREQTRRGYTPPEARPRGGAAQWREG